MIKTRRKTLLTTIVLTVSVIIIFSIAQSFKGFNTGQTGVNQSTDTLYYIKPFKLPEEVTFAGEKMPLDNFDTRESLERELLISAYRHSSTILIIMRANRYLPLIENILKETTCLMISNTLLLQKAITVIWFHPPEQPDSGK
jgi:membrane-bound lytic murein transglycosylase D